MSLIQPQQPQERQISPGLNLNLSTNNPFRKNPGLPTPPIDRPVSRNPFLDQPIDMEPPVRMANAASSPTKPTGSSETRDLLGDLSIDDKSTTNENQPPPPYVPLSMNGRAGHRQSRSQEEEQQLRNGQSQTLDIFADPSSPAKPRERRQRRNSDSSLADRNGKPVDPEEEKKRRERRHRERDARHRDSKGRPVPPTSAGPKGKKPSHRLDVIDKLDVTSIYGTGLFHHDGPFDACNPHRNRKGSQRAPMQAFPKDSANNAIGGSGPVNKNINLAQFHGHGAEGFTDYSATGKTNSAAFEPYAGPGIPARGDARPGVDRTSSFNPTSKVDVVYGEETIGLGATTFLEGAPAARIAIQRRESEGDVNEGGGLSRKRSLAQKIRGISNARQGSIARGVNSPEPIYERTTSPTEMQPAGGRQKFSETNPFFNDYDAAYDRKGASIKMAEDANRDAEENLGRLRSPSSPKRGMIGTSVLERKITNDAPNNAGILGDGEGKSGGFLSRVKSLKGKGRMRPERRETSG